MSDKSIGSPTWDACERCKRWNGGEGCDVPESKFTVTYNSIYETVDCDYFQDVDD